MKKILISSALEPYAPSTLKRAYEQSGIEPETIAKVHRLLQACANFYDAIDLEHAFEAVQHVEPNLVTKEQFHLLCALESRTAGSKVSILPESHFYSDGEKEIYYLIATSILVKMNPDIDLKKLKSLPTDAYDGSPLFQYDESKFFSLMEEKRDKPYYYPDHLMQFEDALYIDDTIYTRRLRQFLVNRGKLSAGDVDFYMHVFYDNARDSDDIHQDDWQVVIELCGKHWKERYMNELLTIFQDFRNNIRLPIHNGYTADEMYEMERSNAKASEATISNAEDPKDLLRQAVSNQNLPEQVLAEINKLIESFPEKEEPGSVLHFSQGKNTRKNSGGKYRN